MKTPRNKTVPYEKPAEDYSKEELFALIERLKNGDDHLIDELVHFTRSESNGCWHGRARAKICRNLKNRPLDEASRLGLVAAIIGRLETGNFSEQFRDQLRLAIRFAPVKMHTVAERLQTANKPHVRRFALWVLGFLKRLKELADKDSASNRGNSL